MYDAIIIGARCAGSPTGMLLARDGYRVLVIDRAKFPSDTLSTHFITPDGVAKLKEWGIFDRVAATGAPINHGIARTFGPLQMPADPGDGASFAPRRTVLDHILVEAAREAGAEVREGVILESLLVEDGVVTGIRARKGDDRFEERGRVVIGADGRDSLVARAVSADVYNETPGATSGYYAYYKNFEHNGPEFYLGGGTAQFVFPTNDGEVCLASRKRSARARSSASWDTRGITGSRLGRAGHWLATPATTATHSSGRGSTTPSAMPACWRRRSAPRGPVANAGRRRSPGMNRPGTRRP